MVASSIACSRWLRPVALVGLVEIVGLAQTYTEHVTLLVNWDRGGKLHDAGLGFRV